MRIVFALPLLLAAAGCATPDTARVAAADCKVVPAQTANTAGVSRRQASSIEQREAEMKLATTQYRERNLREQGQFHNLTEEALRDCNQR